VTDFTTMMRSTATVVISKTLSCSLDQAHALAGRIHRLEYTHPVFHGPRNFKCALYINDSNDSNDSNGSRSLSLYEFVHELKPGEFSEYSACQMPAMRKLVVARSLFHSLDQVRWLSLFL